MPTPSETIATTVAGDLAVGFVAGDLTQIDPFGNLTPPPSTLANYNFGNLSAGKVGAFCEAVSMTQGGAPPNTVALSDGNLNPSQPGGDLTANIPKVQHSVWVGAVLGSEPPPGAKHQAVMDSLAKNKRDNPGWQVNLWTDVPRARLHAALPGSPEANLLAWSQASGVNLVNIDEVFSGPNAMTLGEQFRMEQFKGGTGFAAASDIARLNIVARFGGIYVDADKGISPFDEVANAAHNVGGMGCASEGDRYQNCGFCAEKGHPKTQAILNQVQTKYGMTRAQVNSRGTTQVVSNGITLDIPVDGPRSGRAEIINRTGPTAFREALRTPTNATANQLPPHLVNATVYTTSWTSDVKLGAQKNLAAEWGAMPGVMPTAASLKLTGSQSADNLALAAPTLPVADTLTIQERDAIGQAVKKGVTVLAYTSQNEGGRLDMNHCKFALRGLPEAHRTIALDAIVRTFNEAGLKGTTDKVGCVILPTNVPGASNNIPVATETLDRLFDVGNPIFPNAPMINGTVQHAALNGDLRTLKFAVDYGHLTAANLHNDSLYTFDAGKHNSDFVCKKMDVMTAAIYGGQHEALGYLLNVGPGNANHLDTASKLGAVTPMLTLIDDGVAVNQGTANTIGSFNSAIDPNSLDKSLDLDAASSSIRQNGTIALLNKHLSLGNAPATKAIALDEVARNAFMKGDLQLLSHMNTQLGATPAELRAKMPTIDAPRIASLRRLGASATSPADMTLVLDIADTAVNKQEIQNGALKAGNLDMANAYLNEGRLVANRIDLAAGAHDAEAVSAIAHARYPDVEAIKNDWQGVDINTLTKDEAQELVLKGLAYSETRTGAGHTGRASRVQGWKDLMNDIDNKFPALGAGNLRVNQACSQSDNSLTQLQGAKQSVRAALGRSLERTKTALGVGGHGHGH